MPALPDQPLVHRSWLTRGLFHPSPTWGLGAPPLLLDTPVSFMAIARVESGGSWRSSGPVVRLATQAHVEIEESSLIADNIGGAGVGYLKRRHYIIIIATPEDTDAIPKPNDRAVFTDAKGEQFDLSVETVDITENVTDHIEIGTSWWE